MEGGVISGTRSAAGEVVVASLLATVTVAVCLELDIGEGMIPDLVFDFLGEREEAGLVLRVGVRHCEREVCKLVNESIAVNSQTSTGYSFKDAILL